MTDDIVKIGGKCYIVFANGGQWEDSWSTPIKAFRTEEEAVSYKERLEKSVPEFSEHLHKLMCRIGEISHRAAMKFADEGIEEFYQIYDTVYEPLRQKAELKYAIHLKKENERLQKELSLLLLSQITENDQKLGLYE